MLTWLFFSQKSTSLDRAKGRKQHKIAVETVSFYNSVNRHSGAPQKRPEHHGTLIVLLVGIGITRVDALDAPGRFLGTPVSIAILANFPKDV